MTSTVQAPAIEVERITVKKATALLLAASERQHLPFPYGIRCNGPTSGMLCIDFESIAALTMWSDFFRVKLPAPYFHDGIQKLVVSQYGVKWQGWSVKLEAHDEPLATEPELDAETATLIDKITADTQRDNFEPAAIGSSDCGCPIWQLGPDDFGTIHGASCKEDAPAGTLTPHTTDDHPPMLCTRCAAPLLAGQPVEQRTAGIVHAVCELPIRDHTAQIRRELVEALTPGPSELLTFGFAAIESAPECPGCGVLNGAHQPHCYAAEPANADEWIPRCMIATSCTRPQVANARRGGCVHHDDQEPVITGTPAEVLTALHEHFGAQANHDTAVHLAGKAIDLTSVGSYFADKWPHLNILQRARLVEACDIAGWFGDWTACYRQVMGADTPAVADDATLIVSELDDIPVVSVAQMAAADVEADAREYVPVDDDTAQAVAHRHEGAHYIDVVTVDPDLADASRGGAGIARMTEVVSGE